VVRAARADPAGPAVTVVTRRAPEPPYDLEGTRFVAPVRLLPGRAGRAQRLVARAFGWARVGQWSYARRLAAVVRRTRPRAVVCCNDPEVALYLHRRFPELRVVHWLHNPEVPADRWRRRYWAARDEVASVAVSAYLARAVEWVYALGSGSVAVALNGVDPARFSPAPARAEADRRPVLGFLGRLGVEKGPDLFLEACLALAESRGPAFDVQLVGASHWGRHVADDYQRRLDALVDRLRAAGVGVERPRHVVRAEVPATLRRADVHVMPSRWDDPCPLSLLEAMGSGLAVVATASGGMPELLGRAGLLVPREDAVALAEALGQLLDDPGRRAELGRAARARAEELSWAGTWAGLAEAAGV
jgi:glycosyltransferase involved in cell wall biosynthesis